MTAVFLFVATDSSGPRTDRTIFGHYEQELSGLSTLWVHLRRADWPVALAAAFFFGSGLIFGVRLVGISGERTLVFVPLRAFSWRILCTDRRQVRRLFLASPQLRRTFRLLPRQRRVPKGHRSRYSCSAHMPVWPSQRRRLGLGNSSSLAVASNQARFCNASPYFGAKRRASS